MNGLSHLHVRRPRRGGRVLVAGRLGAPCLCLILSVGCLPPLPGPDTGVPGSPTLVVSASDLDFGAVALHGEAQRPLTVSNTGREPLTVVLATPWGGPWTATPERLSLDYGQSEQVWVGVQPESVGVFEDILQVNSDDPDRPVVEIALRVEVFLDADGDGWEAALDCDESNPDIHPGATERADGVDSDCDGAPDRFSVSDAAWVLSGTDTAAPLGAGPLSLVKGPDLGGLLVGWPAGGDGALLGLELATLLTSPTTDAAALRQDGLEPGEEAGAAVVLLGDVDGDGWAEVALGAPGADSEAGGVRVLDLSGAYTSGGLPYQGRVSGAQVSARLGQTLDGGDLDGDGVAELVAGAPGDANTRGRVYTWLGEDGYMNREVGATEAPVRLRGENQGDGLGQVLRAGVDLTGDGYGDLVACAPGSGDGLCWLVAGEPGLSAPNLTIGGVSAASWTGDSTATGLGRALCTGDWDGDGGADLAIASADQVLVSFGGALGGSLHPADADLQLLGGAGGALASSPWAETDALVVGSPEEGAGEVVLLLGPLGPGSLDLRTEAHVVWTGAEVGDRLGASLAGGVDLDGDGLPELALGAPGAGGVGRIYGVTLGH